ncbi:MAG: hypothetical protein K2I11_04310 [Bacteroides sp.]|nr:hypothetical protein [Bacteroides sp.]
METESSGLETESSGLSYPNQSHISSQYGSLKELEELIGVISRQVGLGVPNITATASCLAIPNEARLSDDFLNSHK